MESLPLIFILVRVQCPDVTDAYVSKFMRSRDLHSKILLEHCFLRCQNCIKLVTKKYQENISLPQSTNLYMLREGERFKN